MTSDSDAGGGPNFTWPPTQHDLDSVNVVSLGARTSRVPEADADGRSWGVVPPGVSSGVGTSIPVSSHAAGAVGRAWLLAVGILIGLGLPAMFGATARRVATSTAPGVAASPAATAVPQLPFAAPALPTPAANPMATPSRSTAGLPPAPAPTRHAVSSSATAPRVTARGPRQEPVVSAEVRSRDEHAPPGAPPSPATPTLSAPGAAHVRDGAASARDSGAAGNAGSDEAGVVPRPAARAAAGASAAAAPARDRPAIINVLDKYEAAYSRMDVAGARAVWPSVDTRALGRAFGSLHEQRLVLGACDVTVDGNAATANCPGTLRYRPRVGHDAPRVRNGRWTLHLERHSDGWKIARVAVR